jgi:hypothetical protein
VQLLGGGRQVEAQRVGVVFAQVVGHVHGGAAALAELAAAEVEVVSDTGYKSVICHLRPAAHVLPDMIGKTTTP